MRFIEDATLNRLSVLLKHFDAGDRVLNGCVEVFTTKAKQTDERQLGERIKSEFIESSPEWLSTSPLGPLKKEQIKELLTNLLSAMNQCFPDYDFSALKPHQFHRQVDFADVYNNINYHLAYHIDRIVPGFLQDLWTAIRSVVNLDKVDIYSCSDPFTEEGGLFAFDYFFYDRCQNKILFVSCNTQSKCSASSSSLKDSDSEDEDEEMREEDDDDDDDDDNESLPEHRRLGRGIRGASPSDPLAVDDDHHSPISTSSSGSNFEYDGDSEDDEDDDYIHDLLSVPIPSSTTSSLGIADLMDQMNPDDHPVTPPRRRY